MSAIDAVAVGVWGVAVAGAPVIAAAVVVALVGGLTMLAWDWFARR